MIVIEVSGDDYSRFLASLVNGVDGAAKFVGDKRTVRPGMFLTAITAWGMYYEDMQRVTCYYAA